MAKYQKYAKYKDSGVEWLVEIPSHWDAIRLKHLIVGNLVYGANEAAEDYNPNNPRYIRITDMNNDGSLDPNTFRSLPYHIAENYLLEDGDILLARSGATVGKSFLFKDEFGVSCFAGYLIRARPDCRKLNSQFAYWFFQSDSYWKYISGSQIQSTIQNVSAEKYGDLYLSLPEKLNHQKIIANFLNHETAKIDSLIAKQEKLIELLKEKRQAVISHAVTKGLNPDVKLKDSGVEWLGQVPEHWGVSRLKNIIRSLESGCSVNAADIPAQSNELGVLKTSCVYTRSFRIEENKTVVPEDIHRVKCKVRKGAIIISRMNTPELVGASALVKVEADNIYLPDRLWQTIFFENIDIDAEYLSHFMTVQGFRDQIALGAEGASSSMQNIAKEDYLNINCLVPPLEEQIQIRAFIEQKLAVLSNLNMKAQEAVERLKERRTALISSAVTGKIDVHNWQHPNEAKTEFSA